MAAAIARRTSDACIVAWPLSCERCDAYIGPTSAGAGLSTRPCHPAAAGYVSSGRRPAGVGALLSRELCQLAEDLAGDRFGGVAAELAVERRDVGGDALGLAPARVVRHRDVSRRLERRQPSV